MEKFLEKVVESLEKTVQIRRFLGSMTKKSFGRNMQWWIFLRTWYKPRIPQYTDC